MQGCWEACQIVICQISSHDSTLAIHVFPKFLLCYSMAACLGPMYKGWVVSHPSSLLTEDIKQLFTHCHLLFRCPEGSCAIFFQHACFGFFHLLDASEVDLPETKESNMKSSLVLTPPAFHGFSLSLLVAVRLAASLYRLSFNPNFFPGLLACSGYVLLGHMTNTNKASLIKELL